MNKSLATISSSLVLAIGLTVPAWAQLGRVGVGGGAGAAGHGTAGLRHSGLSTTSDDRLGGDLRTNDQGMVKGSTKASDSSKAALKAKNKKSKVDANANTQVGASANAKVKKQKGHKNNSPDVQANADARAKVDANAQAQTPVH
jgi:hypothetical protein